VPGNSADVDDGRELMAAFSNGVSPVDPPAKSELVGPRNSFLAGLRMSIDVILAEHNPAGVRPTAEAIGDDKMKSHFAAGLQAFRACDPANRGFLLFRSKTPGEDGVWL